MKQKIEEVSDERIIEIITDFHLTDKEKLDILEGLNVSLIRILDIAMEQK